MDNIYEPVASYEKKDEKSDLEKAQELNDVMNDIAEGVVTLIVDSNSNVEFCVTKKDDEDNDEDDDGNE